MPGVQSETGARGSSAASRSGLMIACLRDNLLYSEKRARDLLFNATEEILADRHPAAILSRLTRDAALQARSAAAEAGYTFHNWEHASLAVSIAMLSAGVLLDETGRRITPGVSAQTAPVVSLQERFRDRTEAYLLEFLIARIGNVGVRDHKALGQVLFGHFDPAISTEDPESRTLTLLGQLPGRVRLQQDGVYSIIGTAARNVA